MSITYDPIIMLCANIIVGLYLIVKSLNYDGNIEISIFGATKSGLGIWNSKKKDRLALLAEG